MKMLGIFRIRKSHGSEIVTSAEPKPLFSFHESDIHMDRWGVGVCHMSNQTHSGGKKGSYFFNARPIHSGFFEHSAAEHRHFAAALAVLIIPKFPLEFSPTFQLLKADDDLLSQIFQELDDFCTKRMGQQHRKHFIIVTINKKSP